MNGIASLGVVREWSDNFEPTVMDLRSWVIAHIAEAECMGMCFLCVFLVQKTFFNRVSSRALTVFAQNSTQKVSFLTRESIF